MMFRILFSLSTFPASGLEVYRLEAAPVGRKLENQIASREGKWCGNGGRIGIDALL